MTQAPRTGVRFATLSLPLVCRMCERNAGAKLRLQHPDWLCLLEQEQGDSLGRLQYAQGTEISGC